ncbi:hypothetical protein P3T76_004027 [Phytophthora citrophthora]|uniref:Uncharacterized protein n=1 Tax=Phytophthora citrophthora TaxID=4793 RepID=A0AAD9GT71_9STRA|nr:hypothetical protein P3T76_004027 [Phytophthora citrophthora]
MEVSVLTCVKVVCREIQGFSAEQGILQRIEAFLDYAPQLGSFLACQSLPLRFVKRAFASQEWGHKELVHAFEASTEMGKLGVIVWLSGMVDKMTNTPLTEILKEAKAIKWAAFGGHIPCWNG